MILFLIGATVLDFSTDKIPNWYILLASSILLTNKIIQDNGIDLFGTLFSILFPILVLFPLFALGFFGAADVKLFGMLGICFSFKEVMLVFIISLFAGLVTGIIKSVKNKSFGERFKYLINFSRNLLRKVLMKEEGIFDESYMDTLDKEMLKKGKIHYSLPILLGVTVITIC